MHEAAQSIRRLHVLAPALRDPERQLEHPGVVAAGVGEFPIVVFLQQALQRPEIDVTSMIEGVRCFDDLRRDCGVQALLKRIDAHSNRDITISLGPNLPTKKGGCIDVRIAGQHRQMLEIMSAVRDPCLIAGRGRKGRTGAIPSWWACLKWRRDGPSEGDLSQDQRDSVARHRLSSTDVPTSSRFRKERRVIFQLFDQLDPDLRRKTLFLPRTLSVARIMQVRCSRRGSADGHRDDVNRGSLEIFGERLAQQLQCSLHIVAPLTDNGFRFERQLDALDDVC